MRLPKIPIFSTPDKPLTGASQDKIPIVDIVDDIMYFKEGGAAVVLESSSLNFGLLSEKEQQAVIAAYSALLNSLSFSIQIVVHSQKKDISNYLRYLDGYYEKVQNQKIKGLMAGYKKFIGETIKKRKVLSKRFFIVIPFSPLELGVSKSFAAFAKTSGPLPFPKSYVIKKARTTLLPKKDHLVRQAGRLGLRMRQLKGNELLDLAFQFFNPPAPPAVKKGEIEEHGQEQQQAEQKQILQTSNGSTTATVTPTG